MAVNLIPRPLSIQGYQLWDVRKLITIAALLCWMAMACSPVSVGPAVKPCTPKGDGTTTVGSPPFSSGELWLLHTRTVADGGRFQSQVWAVKSDGTSERMLFSVGSKVLSLAMRPDGKKLAFIGSEWELSNRGIDRSDTSGGGNVWFVDRDGRELRQITNDAHAHSNLSWSPNGQNLAYFSANEGRPELHVLSSEGTNHRVVASNPPTINPTYSWSPDGCRLAFTLVDGRQTEIYVDWVDGTERRNLSRRPDDVDFDPQWSPDGSRIGFVSIPLQGTAGRSLWLMGSDGRDQKRLGIPAPGHLAWSPDGSFLAFAGGDGGNVSIFMADVRSAEVKRLTSTGGNDFMPTWSPDGKRIAFISDRDGVGSATDLWVVVADGSSVTRLTRSGVNFPQTVIWTELNP